MERIEKRIKRKKRVRSKMSGTADRPRLAVFRSNTYIYGQLVDDTNAKTLLSLSSVGLIKIAKDKSTKTQISKLLGVEIAKLAIKKGIKKIVFDRGGYRYHGRVKAVAEGAREGGLVF